MNEKLTLQDLVDLLAQKKGITKKDAELFLKEFFQVLSDTVSSNEPVKVKDLGTFKLTTVSRRESVDVNTGEKIEIPAHYRLSFQPDKELKELVNKPFASFESILLEDGEDKGDISFDIKEIETDLPEDDIEGEGLDVSEEETLLPPLLPIEPAQTEEIEIEPIVEEVIEVKKEIEKPLKVENPTNEASKRHDEVPIIPPFEYSYSTTINPSTEMGEVLPLTKNKIIETPANAVPDEIATFRETASNEVLPVEEVSVAVAPVIKSEEDGGLSRNLLSENGEEDEISSLDEQLSESEDKTEAESLYEDIPEFYSYQPSFWTKLWRRLPLILFILIVLGGLVYAFLKVFNVQYDYDQWFGRKSSKVAVADSLPDKPLQIKDDTFLLDSLTGETSKKLDSLKQQYKEDKQLLTEPKENIPNVNKAETKLIAEQPQTQISSQLAKETMKSGTTLRTLATRYYGQSVFWVYIYEENRGAIDDPDNIPVGITINIPRAEKYKIDAKDISSISLAKDKESEIIRKARQKRFQQVATD